MSWLGNYENNVAPSSNKSFYENEAQAYIDDYFYDSTLTTTIQEQNYPFNDAYTEYECQIDSVAEATLNIEKAMENFISVLFKDCSHQNYRGQKYIYNNETYLCYHRTNRLAKISKSNLVRCNNEISWIDDDKNIYTEPVYLGYELTSTNDLISKKGITSNRRRILYMQYNDNTKKIDINQRFMFQHKQCFRVEEIDNFQFEEGTNGQVTFIKMFVVFSPLLPQDNTELNICNYYPKNNNDNTPTRQIVVTPYIEELDAQDYVDFTCYVYDEQEVKNDVVNCVASGNGSYRLTETIDGYRLENLSPQDSVVTLTFSAANCENYVMQIYLLGYI